MNGFKMDITAPLRYMKDTENDLYRHKIKQLRKAYMSNTYTEDEVWDVVTARVQLLKSKSNKMRAWEWKFQDDLKYLEKIIRSNRYNETTANIYKLLRGTYTFLLTHDDTDELEDLYLGLVEAVHEWGYKYRHEAEAVKIQNKAEWVKVISKLAYSLQDKLWDMQTAEKEAEAGRMKNLLFA